MRLQRSLTAKLNSTAERRLAQLSDLWHGHSACLGGPGDSTAGDLAGALLAQCTQVDGGPGTVGPPHLRDFGEGTAGVVPFSDLGVQPTFLAGQRVGGARTADHDQLGSERAKPLTCCTRWAASSGRTHPAPPSPAAHPELPRRLLAGTHSCGSEDPGRAGLGYAAEGTHRPRRGGTAARPHTQPGRGHAKTARPPPAGAEDAGGPPPSGGPARR
jgi:hypothetical protein